MKYIITQDIINRYPSFRVAVMIVKDLSIPLFIKEVDDMLHKQEMDIHNDQAETIHPHIQAWRQTYSSFGAKPGKYRCAVEALMRTIQKRGSLPRINNLVDICNYIAVKYVLPVDAMDLISIIGNIYIKYAGGNEAFVPVNSTDKENPEVNEIIYSDDYDVLGRRWNWRKCDKNKITNNTRNVLITIEAILNIQSQILNEASGELSTLIKKYFGARTEIYFLDKDLTEINFSGCSNPGTASGNT